MAPYARQVAYAPSGFCCLCSILLSGLQDLIQSSRQGSLEGPVPLTEFLDESFTFLNRSNAYVDGEGDLVSVQSFLPAKDDLLEAIILDWDFRKRDPCFADARRFRQHPCMQGNGSIHLAGSARDCAAKASFSSIRSTASGSSPARSRSRRMAGTGPSRIRHTSLFPFPSSAFSLHPAALPHHSISSFSHEASFVNPSL